MLSNKTRSFIPAILIIALVSLILTLTSLAAPVIQKPVEIKPLVIPDLKEYVDWCTSQENGYNHMLSFVMVSNQKSSVASFTEGWLNYKPETGLFEGTGTQYFNDRRYSPPMTKPFDPNKTDQLGVTIDPKNGSFTLTLKSWGNGKHYINTPQYNKGLLYGFSSPGPILYVISLQKQKIAIVK
jgi:hypothetical protein